MPTKKPRKIDPRWADRTFKRLLDAREPQTTAGEIDKMAPGLYKHRVSLAVSAATKALQKRKQSWERQLLRRLINTFRPGHEDAESYDTEVPGEGNLLTKLATEAVRQAQQAKTSNQSLLHETHRYINTISTLRTQAAQDQARIAELEDLLENLRISLNKEQNMNDALRASLSGSEIISIGTNGSVTTVRQFLRSQAKERYDEAMNKEGQC